MKKLDNEEGFWNLINLLNNCNILKNIIIMGAWAEYFYQELFDFEARFITNDLDIFYKNLYYKKFNKAINFNDELTKLGFHIDIDRIDNVTKIFNDDFFEVDFLTKMLGSGKNLTNKISDLNINSQALRHLDIIEKNTIKIYKNGFELYIPEPTAYILQKLIINHERKPLSKKEKDIEKVIYMLDSIINLDEKQKLKLKKLYYTLNPNDIKCIQNTSKEYNIILFK